MRKILTRSVFVPVSAFGALALSVGPAAAAPPEPFTVVCAGTTYELTAGNGNWSVGKDTQSGTRFIPTSFSGTVTDAAGVVLESFYEAKNGHRNQEQVTCTFGETFTFTDENGVEQTLRFDGQATAVQKG